MMDENNNDWTAEKLEELVQRASEGDNGAATELINHYNQKLFFIARSYTKNDDDAKDIVQNVWIKALGNIAALEDHSKFEAWIAMIARNEAITFVTSASQKKNMMFSDLDNTEDGLVYDVEDERVTSRPDLMFSDQTRKEIILSILDQLPENQRLVTTMYFYDQLSLKDIAERLDVPMSTVTGRFQHAKAAIKTAVVEMQKREGIKLYGMSPLAYFIYLMQLEMTYGWLPQTVETLSRCGGNLNLGASEIAQLLSTGTAGILMTEAVSGVSGTAAGAATASTAMSGTAVSAGTAATAVGAESALAATAAADATTATAVTAGGTMAAAPLYSASAAASTAAKTAGVLGTVAKVIGAAAVIGGAVAVPIMIKGAEPEKYDVLKNATIQFSGYDGSGNGTVIFNKTGNDKLDEILSNAECSFTGNGEFFNGINTEVACQFDMPSVEKAGYVFNHTEDVYIVEGLSPMTEIDLFQGVDVVWNKNEEEKTANVELITPENAVQDLNIDYKIVSEDEAGNVIVHAYVSQEELKRNGYQTGTFDKLFSLGIKPDMYVDEKKACSAKAGTWNEETNECKVPEKPAQTQASEPAAQADTGIRQLANSYVGRPGLCDVIARQFIYELYGVDVQYLGFGEFANTYDVSDLQPGDLVLYWDDAGNWRHVSVYIGNGQVMAGNYLDGTVHIIGINASFYSTKTYKRVSR